MRRIAASFALLASLAIAPAAVAQTHQHSANMRHVANLAYAADNGGTPNFGTDIEFATLAGREYALAGSYKNGLQIIDITRPGERADRPRSTTAASRRATSRSSARTTSPGRTFVGLHLGHLRRRHVDVLPRGRRRSASTSSRRRHRHATARSSPTSPTRCTPTTVSFVEVPQGSHNQTVHPSGNYLYNSNSRPDHVDRAGDRGLRHLRASRPARAGELALPPRPGLGTESHDITFNDDGNARLLRGALARA